MPRKGWVKIWRRLRDSKVWKIKPYSPGQAWMDILLRATVIFNEKKEVVSGELDASYHELSRDWGWSIKRVRTFLKHRKVGVHRRDHKGVHRGIHVTIKNFKLYQGKGFIEGTMDSTMDGSIIKNKEVLKEVKEKKKNINNAITKISVYDKIQNAFKREFPDEKDIPDKNRIRYWFSQGIKRHGNRFTTQELLKRIYRARPLAREMDLKIGSPIGFITAGIKGDRNGVAYLDRQTKEEKRKGEGLWKLNDILKGAS